jgi:hypothetical protein
MDLKPVTFFIEPPFRLGCLSGGDYPHRFFGFAFPDCKDDQHHQHAVYPPEDLLAILALEIIAPRNHEWIGEDV